MKAIKYTNKIDLIRPASLTIYAYPSFAQSDICLQNEAVKLRLFSKLSFQHKSKASDNSSKKKKLSVLAAKMSVN